MPHPDLAVVTGAFSYTGRYVARRLLDQGVHVRTLTRSPDAEDPFGGRLEVAPLDFSDPDGLRRSMQGAGVFYNTYWIRYAHGRITFDLAVENMRTLFEAAKRAGVGLRHHESLCLRVTRGSKASATTVATISSIGTLRERAGTSGTVTRWNLLLLEATLGQAL